MPVYPAFRGVSVNSHVPVSTLQRLHYLVLPALNLRLMEHESDPDVDQLPLVDYF